MVGFGLESALEPETRAVVTIVCVHGYGATPQTTWHHEETGKTWIEDHDFVNRFSNRTRVLSFSYNSDISANLSAASIAFHAGDLLSSVEAYLEKLTTDEPVIFIAHGFGGLIVKKAVNLYKLVTTYPKCQKAVAGIIFLGTPHTATKLDLVLQSVRHTISAFDDKQIQDPEEESRAYAAAVSRINSQFLKVPGPALRIVSFWEKEATTITESGQSRDVIIVPQDSNESMECSQDVEVECSHASLSAFQNVFDKRFTTFVTEMDTLVANVIFEREAEAPPARAASPSTSSESSSSSSSGSTCSSSRHSSYAGRTIVVNSSRGRHRTWLRKEEVRRGKDFHENFLGSLKGWSQSNLGQNIHPIYGSCQWFKDDDTFKSWLSGQSPNLVLLASGGNGKTYLARAISNHLKDSRPSEVVLNFFCVPDDPRPAIWDYLTWALLQSRREWITHVKPAYGNRHGNSPRLTAREVVDIWTDIRKACPSSSITLIVDGISHIEDDAFKEFWSCLDQIQKANVSSTNSLKNFKALLTSRRFSDVFTWCTFPSIRSWIPVAFMKKDIGTYLDVRFENMRYTHDINNLATLKEGIIFHGFWTYTQFAVEEVENRPRQYDISFQNRNPIGLDRWYDQVFQPILDSKSEGPQQYLKTFLTIMVGCQTCQTWSDDVTLPEAEDAVRYLHGVNEPVNLNRALVEELQDLIWPINDKRILCAQSSAMLYLRNQFTEEQRLSNLADACLRYLLQDCFGAASFPHSLQDAQLLSSKYLFYSHASKYWIKLVAEMDGFNNPQLNYSLRTFLSGNCPQYRTWVQMSKLLNHHSLDEGSDIVNATVILLLYEGATPFFEHFYPLPLPKRGLFDWNATDIRNATKHALWPEPQESPLPMPDWRKLSHQGESALMIATSIRKPQLVKYMLQRDVDVNYRGERGQTALMTLMALTRRQNDLVESDMLIIAQDLLEHGANPNICDANGDTPLIRACNINSVALARMLLQSGADLATGNLCGVDSLEKAYEIGNQEMASMLIEAGADVNAMRDSGDPLLLRSIRQEKWQMFSLFLDKMEDVNATWDGIAAIHVASDDAKRQEYLRVLLKQPNIDINLSPRRTALSIAIKSRNHPGLEMLLQAGATTSYLPGIKMNPLYQAVCQQDLVMIETLLTHGAPVNEFFLPPVLPKYPTRTALAAAVAYRNSEITKILLQHGADPTVENGYDKKGPLNTTLLSEKDTTALELLLDASFPADVNYTAPGEQHPLWWAASSNNASAVRLLLKHGADASTWTRPSKLYNPVIFAARKGWTEVCTAFLEHEPGLLNFQCEGVGDSNYTPLQVACRDNQPKVVRLLLDKGAKADSLSCYYKESCLLLAARCNSLEIVKMILPASSELVNAPNIWGQVPLAQACFHGNLEMVKLLLEAGADVSFEDDNRGPTILEGLFQAQHSKKHKIIDLMTQHGLDLDTYVSKDGRSALGLAVSTKSIRDVRWLLDRGFDPQRCCRSLLAPDKWTNALTKALRTDNMELIDLLSEPRWGLKQHLKGLDDLEATGLGCMPYYASPARATIVYLKCEELKAETGEDIFPDLMRQKWLSGLSSVDYAAGLHGVTETARNEVNRNIMSVLQQVLHVQRTSSQHWLLLYFMCLLLAQQDIYGDETRVVLSRIFINRKVVWNEDPVKVKFFGPTCRVCEERSSESYYWCKTCREVRCEDCAKETKLWTRAHEHLWLDIPVAADVDLTLQVVQEALETIYNGVSKLIDPDMKNEGVTEESRVSEVDPAQPPSQDADLKKQEPPEQSKQSDEAAERTKEETIQPLSDAPEDTKAEKGGDTSQRPSVSEETSAKEVEETTNQAADPLGEMKTAQVEESTQQPTDKPEKMKAEEESSTQPADESEMIKAVEEEVTQPVETTRDVKAEVVEAKQSSADEQEEAKAEKDEETTQQPAGESTETKAGKEETEQQPAAVVEESNPAKEAETTKQPVDVEEEMAQQPAGVTKATEEEIAQQPAAVPEVTKNVKEAETTQQSVDVVEETAQQSADVPEEPANQPADVPEENMTEKDKEERIQQGLQLATLHAFNLLAVRKSTFTPYLPLSLSAERLIAPFASIISQRRQVVERNNLSFECSPERCLQEWRYFSRVKAQAYVDEKLVLQDRILMYMGKLFGDDDYDDDGRGGDTGATDAPVSPFSAMRNKIVVWYADYDVW